MKRRSGFAWGLALAGIIGFTGLNFADATEDRATWFKSLRQPGTGASCCDVSDCRRTEADWRQGQWWAVVDGTWTPIPPNKELKKQSLDGDAYVCSGVARIIFCFVPPAMAM